MAWDVRSTPQWQYWIPGWNIALHWRDLFNGQFGAGYAKEFTGTSHLDETADLQNAAEAVLGQAESSYLADREHTEMREDTSYQRAVADMRAAGLNPFTIGASPANASVSSVGSQMIDNKLQILGYILDLKNLDAKNRKITNDAIGNVLGSFKAVGYGKIK